MKKKKCVPLEIVKEISADYPSVWKLMQAIHKDNGCGEFPSWPNWCYLPIGLTIGVILEVTGISSDNSYALLSVTGLAQSIAALAPWRLSKEIYVIDPDMEKLLLEQSSDIDVPTEILLHLPYPAFFIECNHLMLMNNKVNGFFVHLEYDVITKERELRFLFVLENGKIIGHPLHLDGKTISDSIQKEIQQATKNTKKFNLKEADDFKKLSDDDIPYFVPSLAEPLQIVLYILSINSDITPSSEQSFYTKRNPAKIQDRYAEIRKWNVGARTGDIIRRYQRRAKASSTTTEHRVGSPKAPHLRRGHWHHFWTGKRDNPTERKLILKWIAPTYIGINNDDGDELPTVINIIPSNLN